MSSIIITGSEGLIGSEVSRFLSQNNTVIKLDLALGHDLRDESFVNPFFKENPADYLVNLFALNDHGDLPKTSLFDVPLESVQKYLDVNILALFSVCRAFARQKGAKGIVNFSSTYGMVSPRPELYDDGEKHIGYSISKGAVIQLSRHLAVHLSPDVRVNCVAPGGVYVDTIPKSLKKKYEKEVPMKRMMDVGELNGLIGFLCSDQSSYMTGSVIANDGGWTAI